MLVGVLPSCMDCRAVIEPEDTTAGLPLAQPSCVIFVEDRVRHWHESAGVRSRIGKQATAYLLGNEIHSHDRAR